MKRITKAVLALCAVLGLVGALALPAIAASQETLTWKNIDTNPNGLCGYSTGTVNATPPLPGSDYYVSSGTNYYRAIDPCTPGATNVGRNAGDLKVQVSLHCRTQVNDAGSWSGDNLVWTGNVKSNAQNTGSVSGGLPWSAFDVPCVAEKPAWQVEYRTVVKAWYLTAFGYLEYDNTTHWADAPTR